MDLLVWNNVGFPMFAILICCSWEKRKQSNGFICLKQPGWIKK